MNDSAVIAFCFAGFMAVFGTYNYFGRLTVERELQQAISQGNAAQRMYDNCMDDLVRRSDSWSECVKEKGRVAQECSK